MQETIKSESSFDEWEIEQAETIAIENNYWNEALTHLINESYEYGE